MLANVVADIPVGIGMICASLSYKRYAGLCKNPHDKLTQYSVGRADLYPIGRTPRNGSTVFLQAPSAIRCSTPCTTLMFGSFLGRSQDSWG